MALSASLSLRWLACAASYVASGTIVAAEIRNFHLDQPADAVVRYGSESVAVVASGAKDIRVLNIRDGQIRPNITLDSEIISIVDYAIDGLNNYGLAVTTKKHGGNESGIAYSVTFIEEQRSDRGQTVNLEAGWSEVRPIKPGSVLAWTSSQPKGETASYSIFSPEGQFGLYFDKPFIEAESILGGEYFVAIQSRAMSLIDADDGSVEDRIFAPELATDQDDKLTAFVSSGGYGRAVDVLVVSDASKTLTLATVEPGSLLRFNAPLSIGIEDSDGGKGGIAKRIVTASNDLGSILVGSVGSGRFQVFRKAGGALEKLGGVDVGSAVKDATFFGDPAGKQTTFLFLDEEGKQLKLVTDLAELGTDGADPKTNEEAGGKQVAKIQAMLAELGFQVGAIDGDSGPNTRNALRAFQYSVNLPVTGVIDPATIDALADSVDDKARGANTDFAPEDRLDVKPASYEIYIQFAGSISREAVNALQAGLRRGGWQIPGDAERIAHAAGLAEVRFGSNRDAEGAKALADAINRARLTASPVGVRQVNTVRPGILEVWISR